MSRPLIIAVLVLVAAVAESAQSTTGFMSLPAAWGAVQVERCIETDGDPATVEVLIWRYVDYRWRVVAVQPDGTLCAGRWFAFINDTTVWPRFKRNGGVDVAFLTDAADGLSSQSYYYEVALEHPATCLP